MSVKRYFVQGMALCAYLWSALANAAASFEDNTLHIPYLAYEQSLYSIDLIYVANSDPLDFTLGSFSQYDEGTAAPQNAALFAANVLTVPNLRTSTQAYQIQLDYIEADGVFRLLETPLLLASTTDGVLCNYVDSTPNNQASLTITSTSQWNCSDGERLLTANGIPDHAVGEFPNPDNPNTIAEQSIAASFTLEPVESSTATTLGGPAGVIAFVLNGVKVDAGTGGTCNDSGNTCDLGGNVGSWNIEALGQTSFDFGEDSNNAHVQPGGAYHYHGIPEGFVEKRGGNSSTMTLIGWAADGFPIYARYGYSIADNESSPLVSMTGSYQLVTEVSASRPSVDLYALGTFAQDWEYVAGSGHLDECNGRFGVTPEFPQGIYHYYATDSYPYFQRCVKGEVEAAGGPPPGGPPPGQ